MLKEILSKLKGESKPEDSVKKTGSKSRKTSKKSGKKVVIYTTPTCPWCKKAKEFLKKNRIKYTEKDVEGNKKNAQEMIKRSGQQGTPVIFVGEKMIVGFNEGKLKKALGL